MSLPLTLPLPLPPPHPHLHAICTLVTNDEFVIGAQLLAFSLRQVNTTYPLCQSTHTLSTRKHMYQNDRTLTALTRSISLDLICSFSVCVACVNKM